MKLRLYEQWIQIIATAQSDFDWLEKEFISSFVYKDHRFIHLVYEDTFFPAIFFNFISNLKKQPIFLIYEGNLPHNTKQISMLYAAGVDIIILRDKEEKLKSELRNELKTVFPCDRIFFKTLGKEFDDISLNSQVFDKMPFLVEDSLFEPIKRKILIEISNLVRKLRVKEVDESYNSAGL